MKFIGDEIFPEADGFRRWRDIEALAGAARGSPWSASTCCARTYARTLDMWPQNPLASQKNGI